MRNERQDMFLISPGMPEKVFSKQIAGAESMTNGRMQLQPK